MVGELGCLPPPISLARLSSAAQELVGCSCAPPPVVQLCSCAFVHLCSCAFVQLCSCLVVQLCPSTTIFFSCALVHLWGHRSNSWFGVEEKMCGHIATRKLSHSQALFVICRIRMGKKFLEVKWYKSRKVFWILLADAIFSLFSLCFQVKAWDNFWGEVSAMDSQLQLLNSDLTGGSWLKLTPDLFSCFRFWNGKQMRTVMRGSRKTYCLSQEVLLHLCHESPKLKSNFAFIKLRDKKTRFWIHPCYPLAQEEGNSSKKGSVVVHKSQLPR